jgi:hypothetical protein
MAPINQIAPHRRSHVFSSHVYAQVMRVAILLCAFAVMLRTLI